MMSQINQVINFLIDLHSLEVVGQAGQSKCVSTASPMPLYRVCDSAKAVQTRTGEWELSCLWPKKVSLLMRVTSQ